jgi:adenosine deaminase
MNLRSLPKVELHLHLDCSLSYAVVQKIDPSVTEEAYKRDFIAPPKCNDLVDFLTRAVKGFALMQTTEQLRLVVDDVFEQLAEDNIIYAEIRFAPHLHLQKGLTPHEVVETTEEAVRKAVHATGIEARLILCTLRHFNEDQSMEVVKLVEQFKDSYVAGFDIAGDEAGFPIDAHRKAFEYAKEKGISCTAHAGEARGADSVWETLDHFYPSRIGHGARSVEDEKLIVHIQKNRIHLELCPTSNIQTNMYPEFKDHPVDRIYQQGISMSVNTDCRTITDCTVTSEYEQIQTIFGWTAREFYQCNVYALQAAFIPAELRNRLLEKLKEGYYK